MIMKILTWKDEFESRMAFCHFAGGVIGYFIFGNFWLVFGLGIAWELIIDVMLSIPYLSDNRGFSIMDVLWVTIGALVMMPGWL